MSTPLITPSPQIVVFFVTDPISGAPITGAAGGMSFTTYVNEVGTTVTPPTIVEVGGGAYKFTPTFASPLHGVAYLLNTGTGHSPPFYSGYVRPDDFNTDLIPDLHAVGFGKWSMSATANTLTLYDENNNIIKIFNLTDGTGSPSTTTVYTRTPS